MFVAWYALGAADLDIRRFCIRRLLRIFPALWTLLVDFLYFVSVAVIGCMSLVQQNLLRILSLCLAVWAATFGSQLMGIQLVPFLGMVVFFRCGVMYGCVLEWP